MTIFFVTNKDKIVRAQRSTILSLFVGQCFHLLLLVGRPVSWVIAGNFIDKKEPHRVVVWVATRYGIVAKLRQEVFLDVPELVSRRPTERP